MEVCVLKYDFANLEPKWQKRWEEAKVYALWPEGYTPEGETVWSEQGYTLTKLN